MQRTSGAKGLLCEVLPGPLVRAISFGCGLVCLLLGAELTRDRACFADRELAGAASLYPPDPQGEDGADSGRHPLLGNKYSDNEFLYDIKTHINKDFEGLNMKLS